MACLRRDANGLVELDGAVSDMEQAGDARVSVVLDANVRFHTALAGCTANDGIVRLSILLLKALDALGIRRVREFYYAVGPNRMTVSVGAQRRLGLGVADGNLRLAYELRAEHYRSLAEPLRDKGNGEVRDYRAHVEGFPAL